MRILTVNNTIFYRDGKRMFLNKETGLFFKELYELNNVVSTFQINQLKTAGDDFANYNLADTMVKIYTVNRYKSRLLAFFKSFFYVQFAILKNDFIYVFYPGPICAIIALFCWIYRKPYGVYVRGEMGINSKISEFVFRNASIVNTISPLFTDNIKKYKKSTFTIRPMISFREGGQILDNDVNWKDTITLLYVGRIVSDKGLFELVKAIYFLKEKGYKVHLNVVGNGLELIKIKQLVSDLRIEQEVTFYGMISDTLELISVYKKSNIFILPSYHEGFPRVLYEAMLMRMPILTTFVGSIDYLMQDKVNCIKIAVKDVDSIVSGVEMLINNPKLTRIISDNGLITINDYLSDKKKTHAESLNNFIKNNI